MKVGDLKSRLKELGMSSAGDKATLEYRIKKGEESVNFGLKAPSGDPVHLMKMSKLKPHAAKAGISPIGTLDEIMFAYIDFLKENNPNETNDSKNGDNTISKDDSQKSTPISNKVLELSENDDFIGILNLGGANLTISSSVAALRKAYLKLSLVLHPDKNRSDPNATKKFQALVNAYERVSQPELIEEVKPKKGQKKKVAISRSNEQCKRTRVKCPRCKNPWSERKMEGNPDYFYNFMMTGIKSFNCSTCLFEFGCMTAIHECPFCKQSFEYHPSDFHRKITCGGKKCTKLFGFHMFHCSDRVLKNLRAEVQQLREEQSKTTEQKRRRAESFRRRRRGDDDANAETAFLMGLANECPRCGVSLADMEDKDEIDHLRNCNDEEKITTNKRKKEAVEQKKNKRKAGQELQNDVSAKAAWDFLGASNENMWMLTDGALEKECSEQGVIANGKKSHEMIASLVSKRKSQTLTKFSGREDPVNATANRLPSNLHSMTELQLRAVAASHGINPGSNLRKNDIIELIQSKEESTLMITEDSGPGRVETKRKCIEIQSSSESEFEPDD